MFLFVFGVETVAISTVLSPTKTFTDQVKEETLVDRALSNIQLLLRIYICFQHSERHSVDSFQVPVVVASFWPFSAFNRK